jgi:hypothetical protein
MEIHTISAEQHGPSPCFWPLVRLYLEPVCLVLIYDDDMLLFTLHSKIVFIFFGTMARAGLVIGLQVAPPRIQPPATSFPIQRQSKQCSMEYASIKYCPIVINIRPSWLKVDKAIISELMELYKSKQVRIRMLSVFFSGCTCTTSFDQTTVDVLHTVLYLCIVGSNAFLGWQCFM